MLSTLVEILRYEQATTRYKDKSRNANHLLICISCFESQYFAHSKDAFWCSLMIVCPRCEKNNSRLVGTSVSRKELNWVVDKCFGPKTKTRFRYSDNNVRSLEGVLLCFFKDCFKGSKAQHLGKFLNEVKEMLSPDYDLDEDFPTTYNFDIQHDTGLGYEFRRAFRSNLSRTTI